MYTYDRRVAMEFPTEDFVRTDVKLLVGQEPRRSEEVYD
jgi:hypothetical protein